MPFMPESNIIMSFMTVSSAQEKLSENLREKRLAMGFTQQGLSTRSGVSLPSLRKFEQSGRISLESFIKLLMVLGGLEDVVGAVKSKQTRFNSIDDVLADQEPPKRKRGWRT